MSVPTPSSSAPVVTSVDNCVYDSDGFVIEVIDTNAKHTPAALEPPQLMESVTEHVLKDFDLDESDAHLDNEHPVDIFERPVSRTAHYSRKRSRSQRSQIRPPPPVNVRKYSYVLEGYPGEYTVSEISRYGNLYPTRGTALLLRRFYFINEILDHTHAVGHKRRRISANVAEFSKSSARGERNMIHGKSKLRNEILLNDLLEDDQSDDEGPSFNLPSDPSFLSDLSNESLDFEDFEAPMKTISSAGDETDESLLDFGEGNILDLGDDFDIRDPFLPRSSTVKQKADTVSRDSVTTTTTA